MKKVALITYPKIQDGKGRFLQAYALYTAICELGYDVSLINYMPSTFFRKPSYAKILKKILVDPKSRAAYFQAGKNKAFALLQKASKNESAQKYSEFIRAQMGVNLAHVVSRKELDNLKKEYDVFVCGSDQIWNPYFSCGKDPVYFLQFAPQAKRIAYAASVGTACVDEKELARMKSWIEQIPYRSVREASTQEQLLKKAGIEVEQVMDPTFLMSRTWWLKLANELPRKKPYVLTFLFDNNPKPRKAAKEIAKKLNCEVVSIPETLEDLLWNAKKETGIGPQEFVSLFRNAAYVCTQSFHGTVLSLIYNKPFLVFDRSEAGQVDGLILRIENLLKTVGLESRIVRGDETFPEEKIDFEKVNGILERKQESSRNFLKQSLGKVVNANETGKK